MKDLGHALLDERLQLGAELLAAEVASVMKAKEEARIQHELEMQKREAERIKFASGVKEYSRPAPGMAIFSNMKPRRSSKRGDGDDQSLANKIRKVWSSRR